MNNNFKKFSLEEVPMFLRNSGIYRNFEENHEENEKILIPLKFYQNIPDVYDYNLEKSLDICDYWNIDDIIYPEIVKYSKEYKFQCLCKLLDIKENFTHSLAFKKLVEIQIPKKDIEYLLIYKLRLFLKLDIGEILNYILYNRRLMHIFSSIDEVELNSINLFILGYESLNYYVYEHLTEISNFKDKINFINQIYPNVGENFIKLIKEMSKSKFINLKTLKFKTNFDGDAFKKTDNYKVLISKKMEEFSNFELEEIEIPDNYERTFLDWFIINQIKLSTINVWGDYFRYYNDEVPAIFNIFKQFIEKGFEYDPKILFEYKEYKEFTPKGTYSGSEFNEGIEVKSNIIYILMSLGDKQISDYLKKINYEEIKPQSRRSLKNLSEKHKQEIFIGMLKHQIMNY